MVWLVQCQDNVNVGYQGHGGSDFTVGQHYKVATSVSNRPDMTLNVARI